MPLSRQSPIIDRLIFTALFIAIAVPSIRYVQTFEQGSKIYKAAEPNYIELVPVRACYNCY